jgi:hypothetical protein
MIASIIFITAVVLVLIFLFRRHRVTFDDLKEFVKQNPDLDYSKLELSTRLECLKTRKSELAHNINSLMSLRNEINGEIKNLEKLK